MIDGLGCEGLPAIDLSHDDLSGCHQRPEEHCRCRRRGQYGLGFDPPLKLLVQTLDGVGGSGAFPLARRQVREAEQPVAGLLQAVSDRTMTQPPFGEEFATPILDLVWRLGVDHVGIVGSDLLVQAFGRVRQ